jgi:LuxR family maltose regulon positive regulatory protein
MIVFLNQDVLRHLLQRYPLLTTKLLAPRFGSKLVARPRLIAQLNEAAVAPLVTVVAPAGFGKTTLVSTWAEQHARPVGWVSLDERDNSLPRFWLHLIAALQMVQPGLGENALASFFAQDAPPVEERLEQLVNEITLAADDITLVLDDYHLINAQAVHESLTFFLKRLPPELQIVLISRAYPPLPLQRQRVHRQLVELDTHNLRFTHDESATFLRRSMGLDLSESQLALLERRAEGWVAGLQLAALALQSRDPAQMDALISGFGGAHRHVVDYLSQEVLCGQEQEIQDFLLKSSILERMCGTLCAAVTGEPASQQVLEMLDQVNLFVVQLDDERQWYRYHHLFGDFLRSRFHHLYPKQVPELHRRAADWYVAQRMPYDAVSHALLAQAYPRVAQIALDHAADLWRREELTTLRQWLEAIPASLREGYPDLCLFYALALYYTRSLDAIPPVLARTETLLNQGVAPFKAFSEQELQGIQATIRTALSITMNCDAAAALDNARTALERLPENHELWRHVVITHVGLAHQLRGDTQGAVSAFEEAIRLGQKAEQHFCTLYVIAQLAGLQISLGRLHEAVETYHKAIALLTGEGSKSLPMASWAFTGLAELSYQTNDLAAAEQYAYDSLRLSQQITPGTMPPYLLMARIAQARGQPDEAWAYVEDADRLLKGLKLPQLHSQVEVCRAWLNLQQGRSAAVADWIAEQQLDVAQPDPLREVESVMAARILLAQKAAGDALPLIDKLLALAQQGSRTGLVIELFLLQARAFQAQERLDLALAALHTALGLAEPEGYVRLFLDEGAPMRTLLQQHTARFGVASYTARLLAAFAPEAEVSPDALSQRELEILRLIDAGMSNGDVADTLVLSVGTVKWHVNNIFSKLHVKSRVQAIATARERKLIA